VNKPVIGIVQDSLLACQLLTTRNVFLNKSEASQLLLTVYHGIHYNCDTRYTQMSKAEGVRPVSRDEDRRQRFNLRSREGGGLVRPRTSYSDRVLESRGGSAVSRQSLGMAAKCPKRD
jgi:hypothetical protein